MLFDVRTIDSPPWKIIAVVGDIDLATMPVLRGHLTSTGSDHVALDISGVDHFDPLCFGLMIAASLTAKRTGGQFRVVCPAGRPKELLAETGLDQILDVVSERSLLG